MDHAQHSALVSFIWNIADDVLRDYYVRGKYRDVILPMTVIRRLDALLEDTKPAVLEMNDLLDKAGIVHKEEALRNAAGQAFYNTSPFTLRDPRAAPSRRSFGPTSKPIWTAFRTMSRRSWRCSNSTPRFRPWPKPT